jgi:hypothetical protein
MHNQLPAEELQRLLNRPYSGTTLPRKISFKKLSFAKPILKTLNENLKDLLHHPRKDSRKRIKIAYKLFLANFVVCVFTRKGLSIAGGKKFYKEGSYLNKFFLTQRAVQQVVNAFLEADLITKSKGNPVKKEVNTYIPTRKLEELITPLIYSVVEEINLQDTFIIVNRPKVKEGKANQYKRIEVREGAAAGKEEYYVSPFTPNTEIYTLTENHLDLQRLRKVNAALSTATYALKGPIRRIYSNNSFVQGGRLYCNFQNLPDKKARIRINTLINGEPVAEVDLSCNHAAMLLAQSGIQISKDFYSEIAHATLLSREKIKFLVTKLIGCPEGVNIDLRVNKLISAGYDKEQIPTHEERRRVEAYIEDIYPALSKHFKKGIGVALQALEGDILLEAMEKLIDKGIVTLPIHDALAAPISKINIVKEVLEESWMNCLDVSFKPHTKIDFPDGLEALKLAA